MSRRIAVAIAVVLSALTGASWMLPVHWVGPVLSLIFVGLILLQKSRLARYLVALTYYASGSVGLLRGVAVFFGPHAPVWEGAFLWLGSAALLAAGWTFADRAWKAVLVLLFDALVPPLSLFDWLSPLASAGVLFRGAGFFGLLLFILLILPMGYNLQIQDRKSLDAKFWLFFSAALLLFAVSYNVHMNGKPVTGWRGANMDVGARSTNILANQSRLQAIIHDARGVSAQKGTSVVLLPESLMTDWAGNAWEIQRGVPPGQTWLVGMSVPKQLGMITDSIVAFRHTGAPEIVFNSAFPVPVSMWHPWSTGTGYVRSQNVGFEAAWWEPVQRIDGIRAWASICYDQLLPFVWMEALIQRPQVILLTNDDWWARRTGIPSVQRNTAWAWGRLLGVPEVEAENR